MDEFHVSLKKDVQANTIIDLSETLVNCYG